MVNSYCDSLDGFLSKMVFYGFIKSEDAQCFSVKSSIEAGFFVLAVGAIMLALLNTFVTKAMKQYFRDNVERCGKQTYLSISLGKAEKRKDVNGNVSETTIHPVPVLFT